MEWRNAKDSSLAAWLDAAFLDDVGLPIRVALDATSPAFLQLFR